MLDLEKYAKRRVANLEFETTLERAKASVIFIEEQYNEYKSTCSHDLLIRFGKKTPYDPTDNGYSVCLSCGKEFNNRTLLYDGIKNEHIINATGIIPESYFYTALSITTNEAIITAANKTKALVERARNKMDELMYSGTEWTKDDIEKQIVLDLKTFSEEEIQNEEKYSLELSRYKK